MQNSCSVVPLPPGGLNAGMQSAETVPRGGDSAGQDWLCVVGTAGWETGATGGTHGCVTRKLWVLRVIYGGIPPIKLVSTWKVPRNAYDRAIATY